jgi:AcrR family transcriptional regulator
VPIPSDLATLPPLERPKRADARRNFDALLAAAREALRETNGEASLEEIARRAGVGIGTLYRHFPTRRDLLEAVFRDQVEALVDEAYGLLDAPDPGDALGVWLRFVVAQSTTSKGVGMAVMRVLAEDAPTLKHSCHHVIRAAGGALLARAQEVGAVRTDLDVDDLLHLVHGVCVATEHAADQHAKAEQLLEVVLAGVRAPAPRA